MRGKARAAPSAYTWIAMYLLPGSLLLLLILLSCFPIQTIRYYGRLWYAYGSSLDSREELKTEKSESKRERRDVLQKVNRVNL